MAVLASDIQTRLSGGSANTDPNASLGGVMSSTAWAGGTLHDLFDLVTGDENAASDVEYRCIYVRNNAAQTLFGAVVWLTAEVAGGATLAIGLDPAGVGNGSTTGVATTIANEGVAPTGVAFSAPGTKATGLAIGDLAAGTGRAVWLRRTAANTGAVDNDGATINIGGDTAA